ncbi:MAG: Hpt domain-containing protein [Lachnospiraceae bacterium]|nr:Hpt domain-containing protein [Lachnospiraceae bacterium]
MELLEELKTLGADIDEGLERMMGNVSLYERMLGKFLDVMKDSTVADGFEKEDYEALIHETHTIKGTTGNLSLTPLYEAYSEIVRLLREEQMEQAKKIYEGVLPTEQNILSCIERHTK